MLVTSAIGMKEDGGSTHDDDGREEGVRRYQGLRRQWTLASRRQSNVVERWRFKLEFSES